MNYKLTINNENIVRIDDGAFIPLNFGNADYLEYLEWLKAGNTPLPADPLPISSKSEIEILREALDFLKASIGQIKADVDNLKKGDHKP